MWTFNEMTGDAALLGGSISAPLKENPWEETGVNASVGVSETTVTSYCEGNGFNGLGHFSL